MDTVLPFEYSEQHSEASQREQPTDPALRERRLWAVSSKVVKICIYSFAPLSLASLLTEDMLLKRWPAKVNGAADSTGISENELACTRTKVMVLALLALCPNCLSH